MRVVFSAAVLAGLAGSLGLVTAAHAERTVDFENLAAGTVVTTQYPGVTFSCIDGATVAAPPEIYASLGTDTSSPTRCLVAGDTGSDAGPEFLRMVFANPQRRVQFTTGKGFGLAGSGNQTVRVRWYNSAGAILGTRFVDTQDFVCQTYVNLGSDTGTANISRVEVQAFNDAGTAPIADLEYIDDLTYTADVTPPVVSISSPAADTCVCPNPTIVGVSCDSDGTLVSRAVEFSTGPNGPWTLINSSSTGVCANGALGVWSTAALGSGQYYLRARAINAEDVETDFIQRVVLDKSAPTTILRSPAVNGIFSTSICFDGTVDDGGCSSPTYQIVWRPGGGGAFAPINPGTASYTGTVINDPLGESWNIAGRPDGQYVVRLASTDSCGNATSVDRNITVDNTRPVALLTSPAMCATIGNGTVLIRGTASDANISGWAVQVAGGPFTGWQTIATGTSNITNGVLASWNTNALPRCAYVIRLLVNDRSVVSCSGSTQQSEYVTTVALSPNAPCDDIDFNNNGVFPEDQDVIDFFNVLAGGGC
ncbi:MAG TPA: hypothetical protein VK157_15380 [Phycisphaerales bacterium]|nr:hypothetical protein [Phycisphaerales bacterium]